MFIIMFNTPIPGRSATNYTRATAPKRVVSYQQAETLEAAQAVAVAVLNSKPEVDEVVIFSESMTAKRKQSPILFIHA